MDTFYYHIYISFARFIAYRFFNKEKKYINGLEIQYQGE